MQCYLDFAGPTWWPTQSRQTSHPSRRLIARSTGSKPLRASSLDGGVSQRRHPDLASADIVLVRRII